MREFRKELTAQMETLGIDSSFARRYLNDGFSGGEKKRTEVLQMAMLEPKFAILDESDSGLDIDALRVVSDGINKLATPDRGFLLITHYQRMLNYVKPNKVSIFYDGRIVMTGGPEVALMLEERGYTWVEQEFAEKLRKTFAAERMAPLGSQEQVTMADENLASGAGSTDVGDVSWNLPTGQFRTATFVPGAPGHSWQSAACAGSSIGRKGMVNAAKTLALTAVDLFTDPQQVAAARASFEKRRAGNEYRSRIPPNQKPPLNYRDK